VRQIPDPVATVVCAPDDGWRYHPKHVEQFPDKLRNVASCWIYIRIEYRTVLNIKQKPSILLVNMPSETLFGPFSVTTPPTEKRISDVRLLCHCYDIPLHRTPAAPLQGKNLNRSSGVIRRSDPICSLRIYTMLEHYLYTSSPFLSTRQRLKPTYVPTLSNNRIRKQYFDWSMLLTDAYATSLMDVTNPVFHGT
jgi:hypothetical protein